MKKRITVKIVSCFLLCTCLSGCSQLKEKKLEKQQQKMMQIRMEKEEAALNSYMDSMSLEEKVSQLFIENLEGNERFIPVERYGFFAGKPKEGKALVPGGYLFFSYNLNDSIEGIMKFTDSIKKYCIENELVMPFLAADQEGGFVNRLKNVNGPLPSSKRISEKLSVKDAEQLYSLQAVQMKALGFDMNLAPVIEICTEENEKFLNGRSFGTCESVLSYGQSCIKALEENGIATVIKHFPGNTNTDPHTGLPEIKLNEEELEKSLVPFNALAGFSTGILMSHARTSSYDEKTPACLSKKWVTDKLRDKIKYEGIIFSDDIFMGALADNGYSPEKACEMAIEAGVNCIMISEKRFAKAAQVLIQKARGNPDFEEKINFSLKKILSYKIKAGFFKFEEIAGEKDYELRLIQYFEPDAVSVRMEKFTEAKKKNIELYRANF